VNTAKVDGVVQEILAAVRERGDAAVREYSAKFDGLLPEQPLRVSREELQAAWEATSEELRAAMRMAQANIRTFAEKQLPRGWSFRPSEGMEVGQVVRPLGSVGCYVPGGRYPLPSTLLMTVTPAQVAGVERIVVCSPKPARETMAAAWLAAGEAAGVEFYRIGGAQAVAAMSYGTETIAPVDKIVGPLRDRREDCGVAADGHRYAGRADRDRGDERGGRFDGHCGRPRRAGRA
jgi:histidinol dehydrogenase